MSRIIASRLRDIIGSASLKIWGTTEGSPRGVELTPEQVRSIAQVYSTGEVDAAIASVAMTPGPEGADGLSAYEIAVANGFLGDEETWLESLVGADGQPGVDGADGLTGPAGPNLLDNETATTLTGILFADGSGVGTVTIGSGLTFAAGELSASGSGIQGSTGETDNAVLRADGNGGATLQRSNLAIDDLYTASPNSIVNYVGIRIDGGTSNVGVAIIPKGSGPFSLAVPDGTVLNGNARGANAVDLQLDRAGIANAVASGVSAFAAGRANRSSGFTSVCMGNASSATSDSSFAAGQQCNATSVYSIAMGISCTASGIRSIALGSQNTASGESSLAAGVSCTASGFNSVTIGNFATASGIYSVAFGRSTALALDCFAHGFGARATKAGQYSHASGTFASSGDSQYVRCILRNKTVGNNPTKLLLPLHWSMQPTNPCVIDPGIVFSFTAKVTGVKSDGTAVAAYLRKGVIKRIGNASSLVGAVETIGTDLEDNALTAVEITADDINDALDVTVTGIAGETWRWVAVVEGVEIAFGN